MGGSRDDRTNLPSNLMALCPDCNLHGVEDAPAQALRDGFLVHAGIDPAFVPVKVYGRGFIYLDNAGGYSLKASS
jgi:hypothetical protein